MSEINISELKPNSNVSKAEKEREKIPPLKRKGQIVSTKKSFGRKMFDLFVGEEISDIKKYLIEDLIIPGVKNTILDTLYMAFYREHMDLGRSRNGSFYSYGGRRDYTRSYSGSSSRRTERPKKEVSYDSGEKVDYRNIVLERREDADQIVDILRERIYKTNSVSVAEFFDILGLDSKWTDNNWGWTDERDIGIRRVSSGYLIEVREAVPID